MQMLRLIAHTTSFRQAACVAFVFLLVTLGSAACGQYLLENVMVNHVKEMVLAEIRTQQLLGGLESAPQLAYAQRAREATLGTTERAVLVQSATGDVLYGNPALAAASPSCSAAPAACDSWMRERHTSNDKQHQWLGRSFALQDGGHYVIAYDMLPMLDRIAPVPLVGGVGVFLILLVSLVAGLGFSLAGLRRVDVIRQSMRRFVQGDRCARVPLSDQQDEFDRLGEDINRALSRIDSLVEEVRSATNHIAHELRTPLTRLQHRLSNIADLSVGHPGIREEIDVAEDEARHIQHLFRAVMRISEIETGRCDQERTPIDIPALFGDLCAYYEDLAESRGMTLHLCLQPGLTFEGDRALLFQALINLVDNAFKYASRDGAGISLIARSRYPHIELGVGDEGPGIASSHRAEAVQRFKRLHRHRETPGHGLGLALVQAVADLHGGVLLLTEFDSRDGRTPHNLSSAPGLLALLRLPASDGMR